MAHLIPPDAPVRWVQPASGPAFTLEELQGYVGGYIEAIGLPDRRVAFVNEDGQRLGLPVNGAATVWLAMIGAMLRPDNVIVGAMIVCTRIEAGELLE